MKTIKFLFSSVLVVLIFGIHSTTWSMQLIKSTNQRDSLGIHEASKKTHDHEKDKYESSLSKIDKLEILFEFDPHILDADNDKIPDFSSFVDLSFIGGILNLYSDIPKTREGAVFKIINNELIDILGTIADLSLTRSKSQFLKPLKCLGDHNVRNNPIISVALQDIFATPGSLASIKKCLEQIYQEQTISEETLEGINLARRLAGYFYDQQIIKFLNTANNKILSSVDLSSNSTKLSFLRLLQLKGELFSMLQPTTFNLNLKLPNSNLLKDIRHQLSHITQRKLEKLLLDNQLLKNVLIDLGNLENILHNLNSVYLTFGSVGCFSVAEFWEKIKLIPAKLEPRDESVAWPGLEKLKEFFNPKTNSSTSELSGITFEVEVNHLIPKPLLSDELLECMTFSKLKQEIWGALNSKSYEAAALPGELKNACAQKVKAVKEACDQQLEIAKNIKQQKKQELITFSQKYVFINQNSQENQSRKSPQNIVGNLFSSSKSMEDYITKFQEAADVKDQQTTFTDDCTAFYNTYKDLSDSLYKIEAQIKDDSEISRIKERALYELLQLYYEDSQFQKLKNQAEELKKIEETQRKLLEAFQHIYLHNFYKGGKKISIIYVEFIQMLQNFGINIEDQEKNYNWRNKPTLFENIFHKVYRVNVNEKPIVSLEDKKSFKSQKSEEMLGIINELRELLNVETTVELEGKKDSFRGILAEKDSLMGEINDALSEIEGKKYLLESLLKKINSSDCENHSNDLEKLRQINHHVQTKYHNILSNLPDFLKEKFKFDALNCSEMDFKNLILYKNELYDDHLTKIVLELNNLTYNLKEIEDIRKDFWNLSKKIDEIQNSEELTKFQELSCDYIKKYIELIHVDMQKNKIEQFQGLSNTARASKYAAAREYVKKQQIEKDPYAHIQQKIVTKFKDKWEKDLVSGFYGCEYLLACFYEMFKSINDFPELSCLKDSHKIRNKLFHFDPFNSEKIPALYLLMGTKFREKHLDFVAKETIMLSINVKYLLERVINQER